MCRNINIELDDAVITAGEIVDSFVIFQEDQPGNRTERYLYPYQLPMILRNLEGVDIDDMSFLEDERYVVYLVNKRISKEAFGGENLKSEFIETGRARTRYPGTRFVLPDGETVQDLVDRGFLLKLERRNER